MIYDSIIVGAGPAGITAAIYLARRNLNVLILYEELGGQASLTASIENYSGFKFITGPDFTKRLNEHLSEYKLTCFSDKVLSIKSGKLFEVKTNKGNYFGKSVIICSGARQKMLDIEGEKEFLNRGVAYCATCDAPLFRDKEVAVIGGGNSAMSAVIQLENYAKKVYLITMNNELEGEKILMDKIKKMPKVEIITNAKAKKIKGNKFVERIVINHEKKEKEISLQGVFIEIGYRPNSEFIDLKKNKKGEIFIDNQNRTSIKGIFAAGDVTTISLKQIIISAGEGAKAAISAAEYLERIN